jgi:hypothetical protein
MNIIICSLIRRSPHRSGSKYLLFILLFTSISLHLKLKRFIIIKYKVIVGNALASSLACLQQKYVRVVCSHSCRLVVGLCGMMEYNKLNDFSYRSRFYYPVLHWCGTTLIQNLDATNLWQSLIETSLNNLGCWRCWNDLLLPDENETRGEDKLRD